MLPSCSASISSPKFREADQVREADADLVGTPDVAGGEVGGADDVAPDLLEQMKA